MSQQAAGRQTAKVDLDAKIRGKLKGCNKLTVTIYQASTEQPNLKAQILSVHTKPQAECDDVVNEVLNGLSACAQPETTILENLPSSYLKDYIRYSEVGQPPTFINCQDQCCQNEYFSKINFLILVDSSFFFPKHFFDSLN